MVEIHTIKDEEARKIAEKELGTEELELAKNGRNNWVYLSEDKVISIPRNDEKINYGVRKSAIELLEANNIPTTPLIAYSAESPKFIVTERLNAENLDLSKLSEKERNYVHSQTAIILRQIHQIPIKGFGRLNELMEGGHETWKSFLNSFFGESIRRLRASNDLYGKFGTILESEYSKSIDLTDSVTNSHFLHADYHIGNLLFNGVELDAVIDLDIVAGGDPLYDIAHYSRTFNVDRHNGLKAFRESYGEESNPEIERLYAIIIWTRKIASQGENRRRALKESIPELEKILRWEE